MSDEQPQQQQQTPASPARAEVRWEAGSEAIHPALDFDPARRVAFVTLPLNLRDGGPAPRGTLARARPYIIAVGSGFRNCLPLEMTGLELETEPVFIEARTRWPQERLKAFLEYRESPPTIHDVYTRLLGVFEKYLEFGSPTEAKTVTLWTMMTYLHPLFPAVPYVKLEGPRGSGKSKLCTLLANTAFNACYASSLTPAAVFRIVHGSRSTLIGDEMEGLARNPQMTTLLNAGYKRGSFVVRAGAKGQLASFDSFSPKVLASIEPVSDTLASRTILIRLAPGRDASRSRLAVTEESEPWGELRANLYAWALTGWETIINAPKPEVAGIANRAVELWTPLLILAGVIEPHNTGLVKELTDYAARTVAPVVPVLALSDQDRLLVTALTRLTASGATAEVSTADILAAMRSVDVNATLPNTQAIGFSLERLRVYRARRHTAAGRRFQLDTNRIADLGGRLGS